ncbi:hypothetical protein FA15DRAFT_635565 [Coprinopsis marcescibilis]|uniref:CxC2-like cysteine cluster KDZ transposase-associated domain-containing protein n=1 Tax=Coprinopsis marcescibilis TaxID=230819 RepID=A0A5C3L4Z0_COPMA|nr:hypothetical protein FA15DRAFT_635565 [Coprinopsis marcescibilis]
MQPLSALLHPLPPTFVPPPATPSGASSNPTEPTPKQDQNPTDSVFSQFEMIKARMAELILDHYCHPNVGKPCQCGQPDAFATVECRECWYWEPSCAECFIQGHMNTPTHWAEVWDAGRGYSVRHDIASLPGTSWIQLGHRGEACPNCFEDGLKHDFIVVDTNGVHSTRLRFCTCNGSGTYVEQLLHARLFPSTFVRPRTAFTFAVLKVFQVHHLESAESAMAFITSLRHLSDGFFFDDIADPYDQFRDAVKMWQILTSERRYGHHHNIDKLLPHRPSQDLTVRCGTCPELGINTELKVQRDKYREILRYVLVSLYLHLFQIRLCADGNFHANHLIRHNDLSRNISFTEGRGLFPYARLYKAYMDKALGLVAAENAKEKTTCSFLKAVNKQDTKKFIGSDISGVVSIQCAYGFMISLVNLDKGEKFASTDYALFHALIQRFLADPESLRSFLEVIDPLLSYDISCAYAAKILQRFLDNLPELEPVISRFRFLIPLLHIQNHQDNCTYLFSSAYLISAGHFHGEQVEHPWSYSNPFAGQARQMNHGNRIDLYNEVFGYWNFKKFVNTPALLYNELVRAGKLRGSKIEAFFKLCCLYRDKVHSWDMESRSRRVKGDDGQVQSPYRQSTSNVPSQTRIFNALVADQESSTDESKSSTQASIISMLNASISLRKSQLQLKEKLRFENKHHLAQTTAEISTIRHSASKDMKAFREVQQKLFPQLEECILKQGLVTNLEDQLLLTPADFSVEDCLKMNLDSAALIEYRLLEGAAYDAVSQVRVDVRFLSALLGERSANDSGVAALTRSAAQVEEARFKRDSTIALYNAIRTCLLRLGLSSSDSALPEMNLASTLRKNTAAKRALGDTYEPDGMLWTAGMGDTRRLTYRPVNNTQHTDSSDMVATQSSKAPKHTLSGSPPLVSDENEHEPAHSDGNSGWVWAVHAPSKLTDEQVEAWMSEGDRVQWFRAEAEMLRWQEEWELKLIEFVRTICYLHKMSDIWSTLGKSTPNQPGKSAYARKMASQLLDQARRTEKIFEQAGFSALPTENDVVALALAERSKLYDQRSDVGLSAKPSWL